MSSVRQRIERTAEEEGERIIVRSSRAGGMGHAEAPQTSVRARTDFKQFSSNPDKKTAAQLAYEKNAQGWADYEAEQQRKRDAKKAREQAEQDAIRKAKADAKAAAAAEAERKNRAVLFQIATDQIVEICDQYGLTPAEREELLHRLPQSEFQNPFPVFPKFLAEEIVENRGKQ